MEAPPLIIDLAFPVRALNLLSAIIEEDLRAVFEAAEQLESVVGVPILSEHELKNLETRKLWGDFKKSVAIIELHAGLHVFPPDVSQVDNEGDDIGGICPIRGSYYLIDLMNRVAKVFHGVVLDLTDFYGFSVRRGLFSCDCSECEMEYVKELERITEENSNELRSLGLQPPDPEEILEDVRNGALRTLAQTPSEPFNLAVRSRDDITEGYMFERALPTPRYLRVLARLYGESQPLKEAIHAYLFLRARSRVCARLILDALSNVDAGYKAVSVEGVVLSPLSCSAIDFAANPKAESIEVWLSGASLRGIKARHYNLPRGRYLVSQLDDSIWKLTAEIEYSESVSEQRINEVERVFEKLVKALCSSWTPAEPLRKGSYAVCGWPKQAWDLLLKVIDYLMHQGPRFAEARRQKREWGYVRDFLEEDLRY